MTSKMEFSQFSGDAEIDILKDIIEEELKSEIWLMEWKHVMNELNDLLKPLELETAKARKQRESKISSKKEDTFNYARKFPSLNGNSNGGGTRGYSQGAGGNINKLAETDHDDDIGDDPRDVTLEANSGVEAEVGDDFTKDPKPKKLEPLVTPAYFADWNGDGRIPLSVGWVVDDIYYIDKVVDARLSQSQADIRGERPNADLSYFEYKVKWTGWPDCFNSWVKETDIHDDTSVTEFWGAKMLKTEKLNEPKTRRQSKSSGRKGKKGNVAGVYCL